MKAKVYDPDLDKVHYSGVSGLATICGQSDWIGNKRPPVTTGAKVNCILCKAIEAFFTHSNDVLTKEK